ncbi:MAG: hypothetical protein AAB019_07060 [Planctomycetota bacterium]|mgnify:CR=1 FL=1
MIKNKKKDKENNGLRNWADRMNLIGLEKERHRNAWLRKSTIKERIKILEELLTLPDDKFLKKTEPSDRFLSLSLALSKKGSRWS